MRPLRWRLEDWVALGLMSVSVAGLLFLERAVG
jgi:hypothetical protein